MARRLKLNFKTMHEDARVLMKQGAIPETMDALFVENLDTSPRTAVKNKVENCMIKKEKNEDAEAHLLRNAPKRNTKREADAAPAVPAGHERTKKTEVARSRNPSTKKKEDTVLQVRPDSDEWPY